MLATKSSVSRPLAFRSSRLPVVCQASAAVSAHKLKAAAAAFVVSSGLVLAPAAFAQGVSFANLKDGASVSSPVHLEFQVEGLTVKPAAEGLIPGTGHHHVVIDVPAPEEGDIIPFDDFHKHFGKGQTSADLELAPGKHTLTLQFANAQHQSYGPAFSKTITINVE